MADTERARVAEQMTSTIRLTGSLISAVYEYLWGIDNAPATVPQLIEALQSVGKVLTALRKYSPDDAGLGASVLQKLNARNGPVAECAAELGRLWVKIGSDKDNGGDKPGLRAMVENKHVSPYIRQLEKYQKVFALALQVLQDDLKLSEAMAGYIQDTDKGKEHLEGGDPSLRAAEVLEKRKKDLDWLYSGDYESGLLGVEERSVQGTGEWLKQSPIFQNWMKGKPGYLNLCGRAIGGAGKTHISAKIIHHIQALAESQKYAIAYFFFAHMEPGQKQPKDVLRCLILQLACQARYFKSVARVLWLRLVDQQPEPNFDKLSRTIIDAAKQFDRVFLVFDGLDEYKHRDELSPLFDALATANISVFFTTQPLGVTGPHSLLAAAKIDLSTRAEDIKTYIEWRIESSSHAQILLGQPANRTKFVSKLTECANGMFLFVHLVIRSLIQQPTVKHMFTELQKLQSIPAHKDRYQEIYKRSIDSIRAQPKNRSAIALKILLWVIKAQQTLTVGALREAIAITVDAHQIDELDMCDNQTMLDVCQDLITMDGSSGKVRLVHHSANDCLRKILPADADYQVAAACITYLSCGAFSKPIAYWSDPPTGSAKDRLLAHPFYDYAAKYLAAHIQACELALTTEALRRFTWNSGQVESYLQFISQALCEDSKTRLPLRFAVHVGHLPLVQRFLKDGVNPFTRDTLGRTALHWAVGANHIEVVRLLLDHWRVGDRDEDDWEGEVWRSDESGKNVLHRAARKGFRDIVKLLLDRGAEIAVTGGGAQTALHEAARGGHEDVVQLLLQNGANTWPTEENGETALHVAAEGGHLGIVTRLIRCCNDFPVQGGSHYWEGTRNKPCDVSARSDYRSTPLHLAALGSHTKIVQLLLEEGADSAAQDKTDETVLHQAARGGDTGSIELLLSHGADVLPKNQNGVTVLHRAATRGYTDMIEILLDHGADISQRLGNRTALELALDEGHEETVELLRSKGAEPPVPANVDKMLVHAARRGDDGLVKLLLAHGANPSGTPLIDAAEYGHRDVVNLLLDGGANVLFQEDNNRTVLQVAVKKGHQEVVKLAFEHGAEIPPARQANPMLVEAAGAGYRAIVELLLNHGINTSGKALYDAAANGHIDVVRFLLDRGTNIHFRDSNHQTVFHIAVYHGHQKVVELLLAKGANIHARGQNQQTALHQAVYGKGKKGHKGIVLLLLKAGADISLTDKSGHTALILASRGGPVEVVRALTTRGADLAAQDVNGWTALHNAASEGHLDIVQFLSSNGAQSAVKNTNGQTALILAARNGHDQVLYALLPYTHDETKITEDIHSAFFHAATNGHDKATSLLMSRGALVNTKDKDGRTAFISAVEKGYSKVLEILLRDNPDISEKAKDGQTALFVAAGKGYVEVVRLLLEKGANVSETNGEGQTALFMAAEGRHRDVFALLVQKGAKQFARDRHGQMASIEDEEDDDYGYDNEPWEPHGW